MKAAAWTLRLLTLALLAVYLIRPETFAAALAPLAPAGAPAVYTQSSVLELAAIHVAIAAVATVLATAAALALAVFATRPAGSAFLPLFRSVANAGQTFPPVAVLAIAVPSVGFGEAPTLIALTLYGVLPVFENALSGIEGVSPAVLDAARGAGLSPRQELLEVELPLALPAILSGVRLSAVIALSTATIGSTVAARTLGEVVIAGLATNNLAYIVQGAAAIAALTVLISDALGALERWAARRAGRG
ncbi:ABC transporter permease [Hansschlegelia plantiphila]|uniref:ABC transporter n=1 Tax=Hansschlegelia plantiphila TaxID=374655 RepID=A0A9W6MX43_9HYPH|nr:ABC transporter permease [Hansschlegelia plantiphila]GLK69671.1 ABC transporter [Hansschlegelia plantiphila]